MATDPFANADEAQQTPNPTTTKKETKVSTPTPETQSKIVTTLKGGAGFDAPWIVVHSDSVDEALGVLNDENLGELMDAAQKAAAKFNNGKPAPARGNGGKPAGAAKAPNGQEPPEGYVFKSGMGKNGKPWKAFMPIDRNSGLEVIWL